MSSSTWRLRFRSSWARRSCAAGTGGGVRPKPRSRPRCPATSSCPAAGTAAPRIAAIEPPRHLLWAKPDSTWEWQLTDAGGGTRLVTRLRILYQWRTSPFGALASLFLNEHGDFAMMRKMLRTLKQRAETVSS